MCCQRSHTPIPLIPPAIKSKVFASGTSVGWDTFGAGVAEGPGGRAVAVAVGVVVAAGAQGGEPSVNSVVESVAVNPGAG